MSGLFQQVVNLIGAKQVRSSAYHPQSQGVLERFHSTLKTMLRSFCIEHEKDWDKGVHFAIFAAREATQESLGFSPFELVFGHAVRGPLGLLKESLLNENLQQKDLLSYVSDFREKLVNATELAHKNLRTAQISMKELYDQKSKVRSFSVGDKVLVLLPIVSNPMKARYQGPYVISSKIDELNYIVSTPDRKKDTQLCHANMIKEYYARSIESDSVLSVQDIDFEIKNDNQNARLANSDIMKDMKSLTNHLPSDEGNSLENLIVEFKSIFGDVPSRTDVIEHDVCLTSDITPIKSHPYRVGPDKKKIIQEEVDYMLKHKIIEPSNSQWASPCVVVKKADNSYRFCTDYRKLNAVTKSDSFPLARIDDCIDRIGKARYISKCDVLKGYWGIPLTERAREISAFVTPDGLYQYRVMPYGMKNSQATFQRLMTSLLRGMKNVTAYVDDIVVHNDSWEEHQKSLRELFLRLKEANLTANLSKSVFCRADVTYLGHVVGHGKVKPVDGHVEKMKNFPPPTDKKGVMRFLGMLGYYRRFLPNFSTVAFPLTDLLKKTSKFIWTTPCQEAFESLKTMMCDTPILNAPDWNKPFELMTDASDVGIGAVLTQNIEGERFPVAYFSQKLNKHQKNYSTIEKEAFALLSAVKHFEIYIASSVGSVKVHTDHDPLIFLNKMRFKNRRLLAWCLALQEFNLIVCHIKGKDNIWADALSRTGSQFSDRSTQDPFQRPNKS